MSRLLYKIIIPISLLTCTAKPVLADCWEITRQDNSVIHTENIWHIMNRLSNTPDPQLMTRKNDIDNLIHTSNIDTITITEKKTGWLHSGEYTADITQRDGQRLSLTITQKIQYQLENHRYANIPLSKIKHIRHCTTPQASAVHAGKTGAETSVNASIDNDSLTIQLKNSDTIHGKLISDIDWQSAYGQLHIKANQIQSISYDASTSQGLLTLRSDDHLTGKPANKHFTFRLTIGQNVNVEISNILIISPYSNRQ